MAAGSPAPTDKDLASISEARALARAARQAQSALAEFSQDQIDAIVTAMAEAVTSQAEALALLAVEETGYGVVADKVQKNLFSSCQVYEFIRPMKTVGVINRIEDRKIIEIAELMLAKEQLVVDVVESFDDTVAPGFCFRDEDGLHTQLETESQKQSKASRIAVGSTEGEFIVHLEVAR